MCEIIVQYCIEQSSYYQSSLHSLNPVSSPSSLKVTAQVATSSPSRVSHVCTLPSFSTLTNSMEDSILKGIILDTNIPGVFSFCFFFERNIQNISSFLGYCPYLRICWHTNTQWISAVQNLLILVHHGIRYGTTRAWRGKTFDFLVFPLIIHSHVVSFPSFYWSFPKIA